MNCFYHHNVLAVGTCKCCHKGLCSDCAVDLDYGLACKDRHEKKVEEINMIIAKNAKAYESAGKTSTIGALFYLFLGVIFAGYGFYSDLPKFRALPISIGICFLVFGTSTWVRARKLFGHSQKPPQ